jgi:phosphoserine phosphatase
VTVTRGAQALIDAIHAAGGKVGAVSGGFNQVLTPLAAALNLDFARANELEIVDGKLTGKVIGKIIDRTAKADALREWSASSGIAMENTVAVGDGANDLEMLALANLGVAFNAKPIVREQADLVIEEHDLSALIAVLGL